MIKTSTGLILCLASVLLFGCTVKQNARQFYDQHILSKTELPLSGLPTSRAYNMPYFDSISTNGPYNINFQFNTNPYLNPNTVGNVAITGDSAIVDNTEVLVKNNNLLIMLDPQYTYDMAVNVNVTIQTSVPLRRISYTGTGKIDIQNIRVDHFAATVNGSGYMFLAGKVNRFDGTATGTSRLNAKCVISEATFVNTTDLAQAEVLGGQGVSGLAAGQSDIYYYSRPDMIEPYQRQAGSVMSMVGIMPASVPVPNPYSNPNAVTMTDDDYGAK
ncbi:MAG: hypothetical protein HKM04_03515 [Legionellales bacterium]|nr:hypothetical protein [Legionellales bacterium]